MTRTGRTSCSSANVQQMPKEAKGCVVARDGYRLYESNYSSVELRTLAQECLDCYGDSHLAETMRNGRDPHAYTASRILEKDYAEFEKLQEKDPVTYKSERQKAKAVNFGFPGGLGIETFCQYARNTFGLEVTEEEAE